MNLQTGDGISSEEQEYNPTPIINEIRSRVADWRRLPSPDRLGSYARHRPVYCGIGGTTIFKGFVPFFCQIEAVETIIWLTEVARYPKDPQALLGSYPGRE